MFAAGHSALPARPDEARHLSSRLQPFVETALMPPRRRQAAPSKARRILVCGAVSWVAAQLSFFVLAPWWHPDAEFAARMNVLRVRRNEGPDRPLIVVVGCSRCDFGFQPDKLARSRPHDRSRPLLFNFSHLGAGPVLNLLQVRRLLRSGVRPRQIVLEIMPAFVADEWESIYEPRAEAGELPLLHRCRGDWRFLAAFFKRRLIPWYQCRREFLNHLAPRWTRPDEAIPIGPQGNYLGIPVSVPADYRAQVLAETRNVYGPSVRRFSAADSARRATRELADLCRAEGIELTLLLTPEGSEFQSWYSPASVAAVERFCSDLQHDYGLRLIDARRWLPDDEFVDSHHMLAAGADRFTRRLAERLDAIALARAGRSDLR